MPGLGKIGLLNHKWYLCRAKTRKIKFDEKVFQSNNHTLCNWCFGQSIFDAEKTVPLTPTAIVCPPDSHCHAIFENSAWCQGGAMGEAGIVADPSAASMHYNASNLFAFAEDKNAISLNFTLG